MATLHRPGARSVSIRLLAGIAGLAILANACGGATEPSAAASSAPESEPSQAQVSTPTPEPTAAPVATPAPTAAPVATATPSPTAAPTATPAPTASPAPTAAPATVVDDWVWAYEKRPLTLKGKAGESVWTKVLFGAKTVDLKWTATPASSAGCTFRYRVESASLAKTVTGSEKIKGSKAASGSRGMAVNYGDGEITVTTDCATYSVKVVSTGHPGLTIKQSNDPYKATGTTASELNDELAEAYADWGIRSNTKYYSGGTIRVASFTESLGIDYELPAWKVPEGTDQALIDSWNAALTGMRTHVEGEAAIGIQAAGRYLAATTKKTFSSVAAMNRYRDKLSDKWLDWASDKTEAYNEATDYGSTQGAYIE